MSTGQDTNNKKVWNGLQLNIILLKYKIANLIVL